MKKKEKLHCNRCKSSLWEIYLIEGKHEDWWECDNCGHVLRVQYTASCHIDIKDKEEK